MPVVERRSVLFRPSCPACGGSLRRSYLRIWETDPVAVAHAPVSLSDVLAAVVARTLA